MSGIGSRFGLFLLALVFLVQSPLASATAVRGKEKEPCLRSTVRFDISSLETLFLRPDSILADPEGFWEKDGAYRLVRRWHERNKQPLDMDDWKRRIRAIRDLPVKEREAHPLLGAGRALLEIAKEFAQEAVPHVCSFLPEETEISSTFYFTTEIMPSGIQDREGIVIHILNHRLHNMFVHELFHQGYAHVRERRTSNIPEGHPTRSLLEGLLNEGMATYVGWKALEEFPDYWGTDYDMLESPSEVRRLREELNRLYRAVGSLSTDELHERAWQVGVRDRAYYVVGAYMAKQIDERRGREALIEALAAGPRRFVAEYNALVDESMRVHDLQ